MGLARYYRKFVQHYGLIAAPLTALLRKSGFGWTDIATAAFQALTKRGLLQTPDPTRAASHFFGMLLWIPMNEAMFTGTAKARSAAELTRHADASVEAFLAAYGGSGTGKADGTVARHQ